MDRKSTIIVIVCVALIGLWMLVLVPQLYPPSSRTPPATNAPSVAGALTNQGLSATSPVTPQTLETPALPSLSPVANTNVPEELLEVTNASARYWFSSYGGGLKEIEFFGPRGRASDQLNSHTPAPTLALLGDTALQGDGIFKLTRMDGGGVQAEKLLTNGLRVSKSFTLESNGMVRAKVRLENRGGRPLALPAQQWVVGTATPMGPKDNNLLAVGVMWYNGAKTADVGGSYFSATGFGCVPRVPPLEYVAGSNNVVWAAVHNQYFALAVMPANPAHAVVVRKVELPRPVGEEARQVATNAATPQGYMAALVYPAQELPPDQGLEREAWLYAGPKEYKTLARIGDQLKNNLDQLMSLGMWGFVSKALLLSMNWMHRFLAIPYGWTVVFITVLIRLMFWPLTQASTRSMKRMQTLQPEVKKIQEKYKEDPVKMQRKMMELWKEHKVSPMSGCLPMLIQIPVFFGFYRMISSAIELRGARFLWVSDLAKPDTLFIIPGLGFVPIFGIAGVGLPFNLLPLIMGATMLWQSHLTPPSPGMDPTQAKIMRYLPLIFLLGLYGFSSGLTLYWTVNNLSSIVQTKMIRMTTDNPPGGKGPVLTPAPKRRK